MALVLEQKHVYGNIKGYDDRLEEPAATVTGTEHTAFKDFMNRHDVTRSTILLGMEPRIQGEYMVLEDAKTLWEKLVSAHMSKFKLDIFQMTEDVWSIRLLDSGDIDK